MLLNYLIIKLSESKTPKGAFTNYVNRREAGRVSKMLMRDYGGGGGGWPCDHIRK